MSGWVAGLGHLHGRQRRHEHRWIELASLSSSTAELMCSVPGCRGRKVVPQ